MLKDIKLKFHEFYFFFMQMLANFFNEKYISSISRKLIQREINYKMKTILMEN